jgi:hypothetical protein
MPATAEVRCGSCGVIVIVLPSASSTFVPDEIEPDFRAQMKGLETEKGKRFAIADDTGVWTCPACGNPQVL